MHIVGRLRWFPVCLLIVTAVLAAGIPALAKGPPYVIEVESYDPTPVIDEETEIIIVLRAVTDPYERIEAPLLEPPIELRYLADGSTLTPAFERVDAISFRARFTYRREGMWVLTTHPSFPERALIPGAFPTEFGVTVTPARRTTSSGDWESLAGVLGFGGLLLLLVVLTTRSRWRRGRPSAPANPGDSWWTGG